MTFQPGARRARVPPETTLFVAAHWASVPVASTCGGRGTCGRCRVRVGGGEVEISAADRELLASAELAAGWRLACTARVREETHCLVPEPAAAPRAATAGLARPVALEPDLRKIHLRVPPPSLADTRGDLERLDEALVAAGHRVAVEPAALRRLPARLRRGGGFEVTAVLAGSRLIAAEAGDTRDTAWGAAFDLGTTTAVGALLDLRAGRVVAVRSALNRQAPFGADVISRIARTMDGPEGLAALQRAAVETLNAILAGLREEAGIAAEEIYQATVVGNATMLHLLLGVDPGPIAVAPFVPAFNRPLDVEARQIGLDIHPAGRLVTFPLIGAYVGADTVGGLHAVDLARGETLRLFIDVGTNSEIALGSRAGVVATSAPAGPAFEGGRIGCGMRAADGAIEGVRLDDGVELRVIGDGPPRGLCGSGLIDAVAALRRAGLLAPDGRLAGAGEAAAHPLAERLGDSDGVRAFRLAPGVALTQRDVRELQAAKGAVATGVAVLMERLGVGPADLGEVLLAGAFGSAIDPGSARAVGLVPPVPVEKIRFVGNVALEGAKMALLSFRERQLAFDLAARVEYVELSARADFNDRFLGQLGFPALEGEP